LNSSDVEAFIEASRMKPGTLEHLCPGPEPGDTAD
jgi:hypothetical protein